MIVWVVFQYKSEWSKERNQTIFWRCFKEDSECFREDYLPPLKVSFIQNIMIKLHDIYIGNCFASLNSFEIEILGSKQEVTEGDTYLMQVHGRTPLSTVAIQVPLEAASLNTNDCFVLVSKKETWVWMGKGATGDEREVAKKVGEEAHTANDTNVVFEGQEKDQFWNILGGKGPYKDERVFGKHDLPDYFIPRLFHGSNASGSFKSRLFFLFTSG